MIRRSSWCGRRGLVLGVLVWALPFPGWAGAPMKVPDEAKLRKAEELERKYETLYEERKYGEAAALAEQACSLLEEESGRMSIELGNCLNNLAFLWHTQGM